MDANEFLMSGNARSATFKEIGKTVSGTIVREPEVTQQTDMESGEPLVWKDGSPRMQLRVTLQTDERDPEDPEDDGQRTLYVKFNMLNAVREAVRKAEEKGLQVGGFLAVKYTGDGKAKVRGFNPPKLYEAQYRAPAPEAFAVPAGSDGASMGDPIDDDEIPF